MGRWKSWKNIDANRRVARNVLGSVWNWGFKIKRGGGAVIAVTIILLTGCRARKTETEVMESKRAYTIEREVELKLNGSVSQAIFELKPDGSINKLGGVSDKVAGEPEVSIDTNGILKVKCPCLDRTEKVKVNDTVQESTRIQTRTVIRREPSRWQWFQIYLGRVLLVIFILIIAGYVLWRVLKK